MDNTLGNSSGSTNGMSAMESNSPSSSTASNNDLGTGGDAEGVWSADIGKL